MMGLLQRRVAAATVDEVFLKSLAVSRGHTTESKAADKANSSQAAKGTAEARRIQILAMLTADTRSSGADPTGFSTTGAAGDFFGTCTGEIKKAGRAIEEVICGASAVSPTGLAMELSLRAADGRSAAVQLGAAMREWMRAVTGTTGDAEAAKGVEDMDLGHDDAEDVSPLIAAIVGLRTEGAAQRMREGHMDSSDLRNALHDVAEIFAAIFGDHTPLVVAARLQAAHFMQLVFGRTAGAADGDDDGIGVALAFKACRMALGGIVVTAVQHARDGNGGAVPWLQILGSHGFPTEAWRFVVRARLRLALERDTRILAGHAPGAADAGPPVACSFAPSRASGASVASALTRASARACDRQQRAFTTAVSAVVVKAGGKKLPPGPTRKPKPHDNRRTDDGRPRDAAHHCPFYLAGACVAGGCCSLSHGHAAAAWPNSAGEFSAVSALFGAKVGLLSGAP